MPEFDKVLEAENTINDIAKELKKMKNAADLLNSAQIKVDTVIKSGETIIEKTGEFVDQGIAIVKKINEYDIQSDINGINTISSENQKLLKEMIFSNRLTNKLLKISLGLVVGVLLVCLALFGLTFI